MALAPTYAPPQDPCPHLPKDPSTSGAPDLGLAVTSPESYGCTKYPWETGGQGLYKLRS